MYMLLNLLPEGGEGDVKTLFILIFWQCCIKLSLKYITHQLPTMLLRLHDN